MAVAQWTTLLEQPESGIKTALAIPSGYCPNFGHSYLQICHTLVLQGQCANLPACRNSFRCKARILPKLCKSDQKCLSLSQIAIVAFAKLLRTMDSSTGVYGLRPQLGVPPMHPVLSLVAIAIA